MTGSIYLVFLFFALYGLIHSVQTIWDKSEVTLGSFIRVIISSGASSVAFLICFIYVRKMWGWKFLPYANPSDHDLVTLKNGGIGFIVGAVVLASLLQTLKSYRYGNKEE